MYVCIEVALHGIAHGIGCLTGPGRGAHQNVGPMSQPRGYHWSRVTHAGSYLHA